MAADHFVRQRLSDPSSLTELHLSISDLFLGEQSVKYTDIKGCRRLFKWDMHAGFFVSTWGGGETNVAPHLPRSETKNIHQAKSTLVS